LYTTCAHDPDASYDPQTFSVSKNDPLLTQKGHDPLRPSCLCVRDTAEKDTTAFYMRPGHTSKTLVRPSPDDLYRALVLKWGFQQSRVVCPYPIAYRRAYGLSFRWTVFKKRS
jgi:hypothetical protein